MRIFTIIIAALGLWVAVADTSRAEEGYASQKVVYHINEKGGSDDAGYKPALTNIRNHIDAVGADKLDLRVVMHGDGLGLLQSAKDNQQLPGDYLGPQE